MKKIKIIVFLIIIITKSLEAQITRFNKNYYPLGNHSNGVWNVFQTDSNYLCFGNSSNQYPTGVLVFKLNKNGLLIDTFSYSDQNIVYYTGIDENMKRLPSNYFIQSISRSNTNFSPSKSEVTLAKYNSNGDTIFVKPIYSDTLLAEPYDCENLNDEIYIIGVKAYNVNDADHYDVVLFKTDSTGNLMWKNNYGSTSMDIGYKIISTYDNKLIIGTSRCGYYTSVNPYYNNDCQWWILKLDTAGNIIWDKDFGNPDVRDGIPRGLIETADSNYIITGSYAVEMYGSSEMLKGRILKINSSGNIIWSKLYGSTTPYTYTSIIKEKNNKDLICICNNGPTPENGYAEIYNPFVLCLTPTGDIKWFRSYYFNQDPLVDASVLNSFDFTPDGGYIFGGYGTDYDSVPAQRSWVIKTDSLGFDGVTDFTTDTTYHIELSQDTCYNDTALIVTHTYGITAPYQIIYDTYTTHNDLYYSPMYDSYITDTLILTDSMVTGNDSIIDIPCTITDGLGRIIHDTLTVNVACLISGMETIAFENKIRIYPNPAQDDLTISSTDEKLRITDIDIFNIMGKKIKSIKLKGQSKTNTINIKDLPAGVYFVKVQTDKGDILKKFIKS